jgi:predicted O-methyltransferase YrrM
MKRIEMFNEMTEAMLDRMKHLERIDEQDRADGTSKLKRLRQITPETGKFLALLASMAPEGEFIEIGTSAGYSTMWLSLATKERGTRLKTFEVMPEKIIMAKETFKTSGIVDRVELIEGDALINLKKIDRIAFCFLDCEKELYDMCWDIVSGKILSQGILVADNATSHAEDLRPMVNRVLSDTRFDSLVVPIGKGELVCRRA